MSRNPHAALATVHGRHYQNLSVVTVDEHRLTLALMLLAEPRTGADRPVDYAAVAAWLTAHGEPFVFLRASEAILGTGNAPESRSFQIGNVPGHQGRVFRLVGKNTLDIRPGFHLGADEWSGFDFVDFRYHAGSDTLTVGNRFLDHRDAKPAGSTRARTRLDYRNMLNIMSPLQGAALSDCLIEIPHDTAIEPIVSAPWPSLRRAIPSPGSDQWKTYFWWAAFEEATVAAGTSVRLTGRARWQDGTAAPEAAGFELRVEATAGYLPRRRAIIGPDGTFEVEVSAHLLVPGDEFVVKAGLPHFTKLGATTVRVT